VATTKANVETAKKSATTSIILNWLLSPVREQCSQYLKDMHNGLDKTNVIISYCESHWEKQIIEIENIIKKLECNELRTAKLTVKSILTKAKKNLEKSESYSVTVRQALNRDLILAVRIFIKLIKIINIL
jgi:hypothetical protein